MKLIPENIIKVVAGYYNIPLAAIFTTSQKSELVIVRQVSCYFIREIIDGASYESIGQLFPGRNGKRKDHATTMHSIKAVNNLIDTDKVFRSDIEKIRRQIIEIPKVKTGHGKFLLINKYNKLRQDYRELRIKNYRLEAELLKLKTERSGFNLYAESEKQTVKAYHGYQPIR
jgi:hypothetical protein